MKGKIIILLILTFSCTNTQKHYINYSINLPNKHLDKRIYLWYLYDYGFNFNNLNLKLENEVKIHTFINSYFKNSKYQIVYKGDIDADGVQEYFIVEPFIKLRRAITRGVIIDENLVIKLIIDTNIGIYSPQQKFTDLSSIGHYKNEVVRFIIGFIDQKNIRDMGYNIFSSQGRYSLGFTKQQKEFYNKNKKRTVHRVGTISIQRIDSNLHVIDGITKTINSRYQSSDIINIMYYKNARVLFEKAFPWPDHQILAYQKNCILQHRRYKKLNKTYMPPQKINKKNLDYAIWWIEQGMWLFPIMK